jgi:hypothetical protein
MWLVIFYVFFSACFTWGVTHGENDRTIDVLLKAFLSFTAGWFMMPIYLGSWLDLKR